MKYQKALITALAVLFSSAAGLPPPLARDLVPRELEARAKGTGKAAGGKAAAAAGVGASAGAGAAIGAAAAKGGLSALDGLLNSVGAGAAADVIDGVLKPLIAAIPRKREVESEKWVDTDH